MRDIDPMSEENQQADADNRRYIGGLKLAAATPTVETFDDGSTIETDPATGNRTVFGKMAHDAYFERLREERITRQTPYAVMAYCRDVDGTRKVELIRRITQPLLAETFGPYSYEVWTASDPENVTRVATLERGMELFKQFALHGTNGFSVNS